MTIQDPIYQNKVEFLHGDREQAIAEMKALGVHDDSLPEEKQEGLVTLGDLGTKKCIVIWVVDAENIPLLTHEIYHLVDFAFDYMGIEGDNDSEFGACLAEYYMREILKHLEG